MTGGVAVILGRTGRNLGAGMSGGVAYVYKLRGDRVNHDALAAGELHVGALEAADATKLEDILKQHVAETGSALAKRILDNFAAEVEHFVRVLPRDYASVLSIREKAVANGVDPDSSEVWEQILEVTRG
jgi:glutamate synthase (NADPH/NADH) large chain